MHVIILYNRVLTVTVMKHQTVAALTFEYVTDTHRKRLICSLSRNIGRKIMLNVFL